MKKYLYPALVLTLLVVLGLVYQNYQRKRSEVPMLHQRSKAQMISTQSEWLNTKQAIETLLDQLRRHPEDPKTKIELAMAYVQEGRVTGDHTYYDEAALQLVQQVLDKNPDSYQALNLKATLLLSQHHFTDALAVATTFNQKNPDAASGYGLLCDANLELGNYKAAVENVDKMVATRPDLRSYSRVAYLREIYGDYDGAKQAMQMAVKASTPGLEQTEWCRTQLAKLHELTGDTAKAAQLCYESLIYRPNYAYALAGLGRLALAAKQPQPALEWFQKAAEQTQDYAFLDDMTDCLALIDSKKAEVNAQAVIKKLSLHASDDKAAPDKGHYADKELAYAYLKVNNTDKALEHATREWNRRPDNIDVNECLAWVFFQKNDIVNADRYIKKALVTNSKNPILLQRAQMIAQKLVQNAKI